MDLYGPVGKFNPHGLEDEKEARKKHCMYEMKLVEF